MNLRYFLACIFSVLILSGLKAQQPGLPVIKNYHATEYKASVQNWCAVQDHRGVMYFGNDGVLEYDGVNWNLYKTRNESTVRSLALSKDNIVLVGAVGEFGYLAPRENGILKYQSLSAQLDSSFVHDVWKLYSSGDSIWFCTVSNIYHFVNYKYHNTIPLFPKTSFFTFYVDNILYFGDYFKGLCRVANDSLLQCRNGGFFSQKDIFSVQKKSDDTLLIITGQSGVFEYAVSSGNVTNISGNELNQYNEDFLIYNGEQVVENYCFGTIGGGVAYLSDKNNRLKILNKKQGLQDESVINLYQSAKFSPLWITLDFGISSAYLNFPFQQYSDKDGINGSIYDACVYNGNIVVATSAGVFYSPLNGNEAGRFSSINGIQNQTWKLYVYRVPQTGKEILLAGTIKGLFEINTSLKATEIKERRNSEVSLSVYSISASKKNPSNIYLALPGGYWKIGYNAGQWDFIESDNSAQELRDVIEDRNGDIWASTQYKGVYYKNSLTGEELFLGKDAGFESENQIKLAEIDNQLYFFGKGGCYIFDKNQNRMLKSDDVDPAMNNNDLRIDNAMYHHGVLYMHTVEKEHQHILAYQKTDSGFIEASTPFRYFDNQPCDGIFVFGNTVMIGLGSSLYFYNNTSKYNYYEPYYALVRKVGIEDSDSILFAGTYYQNTDSLLTPGLVQPENLVPRLAYSLNDLVFQIAAPYFFEEASTQFSVFLEGNDSKWSNWSGQTRIVKNNLREGSYTFKVKARNIWGIESEVGSYRFSIAPPWYRTLLAIFIYLVAGVFAIIGIVKWNTRRLRLEKIRLEGIVQERTREILEQKNEIEKQRDQITQQKEEITSSIQYASKIQRAVLPSKEKADELLKDYFVLFKPRDIVSGDFYWMSENQGKVFVAAADCTGHGVPGAFMSMLGVSFLNEIVNKSEVNQANIVLNKLRENVKSTLKQKGQDGESKDGMDIALCVIDFAAMKVQYAGAYNPLYLIRNGELLETKADKNPIGIYLKEKDSFTNHEIELLKGDQLYMFSDGYVDQFGGEKCEKYKSKNFKEFLLSIQHLSMEEQKHRLDENIINWRGEVEQIDDILVVGVRM